jgi:transcription elongation factor GreB
VRLAGIEPTTPWFVAKYSIQLSYSRIAIAFFTTTRDYDFPGFLLLYTM